MAAEIIPLREKPKRQSGAFSTGLALFSMFFGAGNLIFPLVIGRTAGTETSFAILGLGLSAVAFPFLGLIAMMLFSGDIRLFLSRLGKWPAFALLLILQLSQGPTGAVPRLVTLMHASIKSYFPSFSLAAFSIVICVLTYFLTVRPSRIIALLGVVLTPLLLLTLTILISVGMFYAPPAPIALESSSHFFSLGLKMGYQTTDLIAALLFATVVLPHLSLGTEELSVEEARELIRRRMTLASLLAAGLLMISYIGLCWLSAHHSGAFSDLPHEDLLQAIAIRVLGPAGGWVASLAVFLACLTTAISLCAVFARYLQSDLLPKLDYRLSLGLTLTLAALMANLGFGGIMKLWGPLLDILYPALIVLCIFNIAHSLYRVQSVKAPVFFILGLAVGGFFFG